MVAATDRRGGDDITTASTGLGFRVNIGDSTLALDVTIHPNFWINRVHIVSGAATHPFALTTALELDWK